MSRLCRFDLVCFVLLTMLLSSWPISSVAFAARAPRVAVVPFGAEDVSESTADFLAEFLRDELGRTAGLEVLSAEGQPRGCFSVECGVKTAAKIGADRVVLGRARLEGGEYRLELRIVDLRTRADLLSVTARAETEDGLFPRAGGMVGELQAALRKPLAEDAASSTKAGPLRITHQMPASARAGEKLYLEASVSPALGSRRIEVLYESAKGVRGSVLCGDTGNSRYLAEIPSAIITPGTLRYYFRVTENGQEVAREPAAGFLELAAVTPSASSERTPERVPPGQQPPKQANEAVPSPARTSESGSARDSAERGSSKKIWWIGGIVGAAAVAVLALAGGGDGGDGGDDPPAPDQTLPEPPGH